MADIIAEKLKQAVGLVAEANLDVWLTFVRETGDGGDPVLPFLITRSLTWQSALMVSRSGEKVAVVGNYDSEPLASSGHWSQVVPYVQSIEEPLIAALERLVPADVTSPRIGVNFDTEDDKTDGLSHGMFLLLKRYLRGTRFAKSLVSASGVVSALRSQKSHEEIRCMRLAIVETDRLFDEVTTEVSTGFSEREVFDLIQTRIDARGFGYAWDRTGDPIVNTGPQSMVGHGLPSSEIAVATGHILHIDLGVTVDGYSSDLQRCWYVGLPGEPLVPSDVAHALSAVSGAISAGAHLLKPGVQGWKVDAAARKFILDAGYPEYMHALGHQVGRVAHDGGALLGPRWERYGRAPFTPVRSGEVYTLELGVMVDGRGYLGLEEMVLVTDNGIEWMSERQEQIWRLRAC